MIKGTKVQMPCSRAGRPAFTQCSGCKKYYTALGISRHWAHCPAKETK